MKIAALDGSRQLLDGSAHTQQTRVFALWFTGLSGSGKSTLAQAVRLVLKEQHGIACGFLDGDTVRATLSRDLGFSREDRIANTFRIGMQAHLLAKQGIPALVASIAPYRAARLHVRKLVEATGGVGSFVEIFVDCPVDICMSRDPKGLYARARAGLLTGLSGVDDPYEAPEHPDVHLRTDLLSVQEAVQKVLECLATRQLMNGLPQAVKT